LPVESSVVVVADEQVTSEQWATLSGPKAVCGRS
jgi:hypothetical protein